VSTPLPPGAAIGILGGGQLGRMLAMAAARLGFDVVVLTPEPDAPASRVAARTIVAEYTDPGALAELARLTAVVTYEFENVPAAAVDALLAAGADVAPGGQALATAQDRVTEKCFFRSIGAPTVDFEAIDGPTDIPAALERLGAPALLKTRREGYDGKGQTWVADAADADDAWRRIGAAPAILEARASFRRELSVIAARGPDGVVAIYPLAENHHEDGILRRSIAPAVADEATARHAVEIATEALTRLDYVGVLGLELFETDGGALLVNEFAPRVHNSGHWTLDACEVDQFEQHIRAIAGWPLGPTTLLAAAEMENLLGEAALDGAALARDPAARLWLYGKREAAPGRKMGHITRLSPLSAPGRDREAP
jgi:5-(carboxyamino)imidazole ribonucleotide synthase